MTMAEIINPLVPELKLESPLWKLVWKLIRIIGTSKLLLFYSIGYGFFYPISFLRKFLSSGDLRKSIV